jgi:hypothetical protein
LLDRIPDRTRSARLVRKIAVSLTIGVSTYLIVSMLARTPVEPQLLGFTLSVFIGGVALVTQVLVDFVSRLVTVEDSRQRHAEHMDDLVLAGFAKVNEATALFSLVESPALRADVVIQLVRHATLLHPSPPQLIFRFAEAEIGRMSQFLKGLGEGIVACDGEDRDWMLALAGQALSSIDAHCSTS